MHTRLSIIGTGAMAHHHARNLSEISNVRLVACCDIDVDRAEGFAAEYGIPHAYGSLQKMLDAEELDGASVVTSDSAHAETVLALIERGVPVMCEKPLAPELADAERMAAAAAEAGVVNAVNLLKRNGSGLQEAAERIARGDIGEVTHVEASYLQSWVSGGGWRNATKPVWRLSRRLGGGTLADLGPHAFDLATFLCGPLTSISCTMSAQDKGLTEVAGEPVDADDGFVASVMFANRAVGLIHASRTATGCRDREFVRVFGQKGAVEVDFGREQVDFAEYGSRYLFYTVDQDRWMTIRAKPRPTTYQRFVKAIRGCTCVQADFAVGVQIQRYLDASRRSHETGTRIELSPVPATDTAFQEA